jgi:hypothetical protein
MQFIIFREIWETMEGEDIDLAKEDLVSKAKKLKVYFFFCHLAGILKHSFAKKRQFWYKR